MMSHGHTPGGLWAGHGRHRDFAAESTLDHFVAGFDWAVPQRIELVGFDWLERVPGQFAGHRVLWYAPGRPRRAHTRPGLLEGFLELARKPDEAVLSYARRWGP